MQDLCCCLVHNWLRLCEILARHKSRKRKIGVSFPLIQLILGTLYVLHDLPHRNCASVVLVSIVPTLHSDPWLILLKSFCEDFSCELKISVLQKTIFLNTWWYYDFIILGKLLKYLMATHEVSSKEKNERLDHGELCKICLSMNAQRNQNFYEETTKYLLFMWNVKLLEYHFPKENYFWVKLSSEEGLSLEWKELEQIWDGIWKLEIEGCSSTWV